MECSVMSFKPAKGDHYLLLPLSFNDTISRKGLYNDEQFYKMIIKGEKIRTLKGAFIGTFPAFLSRRHMGLYKTEVNIIRSPNPQPH
jgi:hypothetical protein